MTVHLLNTSMFVLSLWVCWPSTELLTFQYSFICMSVCQLSRAEIDILEQSTHQRQFTVIWIRKISEKPPIGSRAEQTTLAVLFGAWCFRTRRWCSPSNSWNFLKYLRRNGPFLVFLTTELICNVQVKPSVMWTPVYLKPSALSP